MRIRFTGDTTLKKMRHVIYLQNGVKMIAIMCVCVCAWMWVCTGCLEIDGRIFVGG